MALRERHFGLEVGLEEDEGGDEGDAEEDDQKGPPGVDPGLLFVCAHVWGVSCGDGLMVNEMGAGLNRGGIGGGQNSRFPAGMEERKARATASALGWSYRMRGAIFSSCS